MPNRITSLVDNVAGGLIGSVIWLIIGGIATIVAANLKPELIAVVIAIAGFTVAGWFAFLWIRGRNNVKTIRGGFDTSTKLLRFDESLVRKLPAIANANPSDPDLLVRLLRPIITEICEFYDDLVARGTILRVEGESLRVCASKNMPDESLRRLEFSLAASLPVGQNRGIAAKALLTNETIVVTMKKLPNGQWQPSDSDYIPFEAGRTIMPYKSFVAVPITWPEGNGYKPLGVLCLDSPSETVFSDTRASILPALALRIAVAMTLYYETTSAMGPGS